MNITVNGINTYYLSEGSGETILLLHGWGCHGEIYRGVINHLSKKHNVIVPDLPGFGKTPEPPYAWGVGDYAEFIKQFCDEINIKKFILFGHSLGGRIIIKLLSDNNNKNNNNSHIEASRIIITGGAGIEAKNKQGFKFKLKSRVFKTGKAFLNIGLIRKTFPNALENLRRRNGSPDYVAASPMMRQCLVKIVNEDLTPLLSAVKPSVLLIWGENDDQTPLSDGQLMEKTMPDAGLAVIRNAGHYAFLDQKESFYKILNSFLKG